MRNWGYIYVSEFSRFCIYSQLLPLEIFNIKKIMSVGENILNTFGTLLCALIVIALATYIPYEIITSENDTVIDQKGNWPH